MFKIKLIVNYTIDKGRYTGQKRARIVCFKNIKNVTQENVVQFLCHTHQEPITIIEIQKL